MSVSSQLSRYTGCGDLLLFAASTSASLVMRLFPTFLLATVLTTPLVWCQGQTPVAVGMTSGSGLTQTFSFTFSDAGGALASMPVPNTGPPLNGQCPISTAGSTPSGTSLLSTTFRTLKDTFGKCSSVQAPSPEPNRGHFSTGGKSDYGEKLLDRASTPPRGARNRWSLSCGDSP